MIMPKYKSILKDSQVVSAGRKRKCYHNKKHQISKGDIVLEVKEGAQTPQGYCIECGKEMIRIAEGCIQALKADIMKEY